MEKKAIFKIILAGDGGVGKSTLLATKAAGKFSYCSKITIGIDFACLLVEQQDHPISLLVYDLGGQQRFHFLHDAYLKGTKGAIILYDTTRPSSFENIPLWVDLIRKENNRIPIILAGSKIDMVQPEDLLKYQKDWKLKEKSSNSFQNVKDHLFISSKDLYGLDLLFSRLINEFTLQEINSTTHIPSLIPFS